MTSIFGLALVSSLFWLGACESFSSTAPGDEEDASSAADATAPEESSVPAPATADAANAGDGATPGGDAGDAGARRLRVFITDVGYADATTPAAADAKCQAEAKGRLPGKFVAWFSSNAAPALSRLVAGDGAPVDGPWFRVDGARVAVNRAALVDTMNVPLESPINLSATGTLFPSSSVWTATLADGGVGNLCPGMNPTKGGSGQVGPGWTEHAFFVAACGNSLSIYCFQVE